MQKRVCQSTTPTPEPAAARRRSAPLRVSGLLSMGLLSSKEGARLEALQQEDDKLYSLLHTLRPHVAADVAAGRPVMPGTKLALYHAAVEHLKRLQAEREVIFARQGECRTSSRRGL